MKDPFIKVYKNSIPKKLCRQIIKKFEQDPNKKEGVTLHGYTNSVKRTIDLHLFDVVKDLEWKKIDTEVYKFFNASLLKYKQDIPGNMRSIVGEVQDTGYNVQRYMNNGSDGFDWHADGNSLAGSNRILAAIMYLNSVKKGGETEFQFHSKHNTKPVEGSILIFPSNFQYVHRGITPISNPKYIISTFLVFKN